MGIEIQEAELLTSNFINDTTRIWKQGERKQLDFNEQIDSNSNILSTIDLTFHRTPRNHVITGMRLRYEGRVLLFDIASSAVNILNGVISLTTPTWITSEYNWDNFVPRQFYGNYFHPKQVFSDIPRPLEGAGLLRKERSICIGLYM